MVDCVNWMSVWFLLRWDRGRVGAVLFRSKDRRRRVCSVPTLIQKKKGFDM